MTAHVGSGEALTAQFVRQDAGGKEFSERNADRAPDRVRIGRHAFTP